MQCSECAWPYKEKWRRQNCTQTSLVFTCVISATDLNVMRWMRLEKMEILHTFENLWPFKALFKHFLHGVCVSSSWWVAGAVKANSLCRSVMYCLLSRGNPKHSESRRSDSMRKLAAIITRALINISAASAGISYSSLSLSLSSSVWLLPLWIAEYIGNRKTLRK